AVLLNLDHKTAESLVGVDVNAGRLAAARWRGSNTLRGSRGLGANSMGARVSHVCQPGSVSRVRDRQCRSFRVLEFRSTGLSRRFPLKEGGPAVTAQLLVLKTKSKTRCKAGLLLARPKVRFLERRQDYANSVRRVNDYMVI